MAGKYATATLKLGVEGGAEFVRSMNENKEAVAKLKREQEELTSAYDRNDASVEKLSALYSKQSELVAVLRSSLEKNRAEVERLNTTTSDADKQTKYFADAETYLEKQLHNSIVAYNKATVQLDNYGKALQQAVERESELSQTIHDSERSISVLEAAYRKLDSSVSKENRTESDYLVMMGNLARQRDLATTKAEAYRQKIDNLLKSTDEVTQETSEFKDELAKLYIEMFNSQTEANNLQRRTDELGREMDELGRDSDKAGKEIKETGQDIKDTGEKSKDASFTIQDLARAMGIATTAGELLSSALRAGIGFLKQTITETVKYNADLEMATKTLSAFVGQAGAEGIVADMKDLSKVTGQSALDLIEVSRNFTAAGLSGEETSRVVEGMSKTFLALGTSTSNANNAYANMIQLLNYAQAGTKIQALDWKQFQAEGIPIYQMLADSMGKSLEEVIKLKEQGAITFYELADAYAYATGEGGMFYDAVQAGTDTVTGKWNVLKATWQDGLSEALMPISDELRENLIPLATEFVENIDWSGLGERVATVAGAFGDFATYVKDLKENSETFYLISKLFEASDTINGTIFDILIGTVKEFIRVLDTVLEALGIEIPQKSEAMGTKVEKDFRKMQSGADLWKLNTEKASDDILVKTTNDSTAVEKSWSGAMAKTKEETESAFTGMGGSFEDYKANAIQLGDELQRELAVEAKKTELEQSAALKRVTAQHDQENRKRQAAIATFTQYNSQESSKTVSMWINSAGSISSGLDSRWRAIAESARTWGSHLVSNFASGINAGVPAVHTAAQAAANAVRMIMQHSVPSEGPLANELQWMPDMMDNFARGIYDNIYKVEDAARATAAAIAAPAQTVTNMNVGGISVYAQEGQSAEEIADYVLYKLNVEVERSKHP